MSLKSTLKLIYVSTLLVIILGAAGYLGMSALGDSIEDLIFKNKKTELIGDLQTRAASVVMPGNDYLLTGDVIERENLATLDREMEQAINDLAAILASPEEQVLVDKVRADYKEIRTDAQKILELPNPVNNPVGGEMMETMDQKAVAMEESLEQLHEIIRNETQSTIENTNARKRNILILVLGTSVLAVSFCCIVTIIFRKGIIWPLINMSEIAGMVSRGMLTDRVKVNVKGEIGELVGPYPICRTQES